LAGNSSETGRSVTSKVVAILLAFTDGDILSLTEIARRTELPTSTAHRLVSELAAWGLLERTDDVQYRVGEPLRAIGGTAAGMSSISERARRVMEDVSTAIHSDVRLGTLHGTEVHYIEKTAGYQPVTPSPVGSVPAHASAMGKAILAFSPPKITETIIAHGLAQCTPCTITSAAQLRKTLARVRLTRLAISQGEARRTQCAVAVPVFGGSNLVAALEVDVRDLSSDLKLLPPVLHVASRSLSRELVVTHAVGRATLVAAGLRTADSFAGAFVGPPAGPADNSAKLRGIRLGA
jgi:DNA-binding IclR family transcriptional regulator